MSKRNIYFGGFSLAIAGAAIAGGVAVSSSAMADSNAPANDLNTVQVISLSADGEAFECEYQGIDLPSFVIGEGDGVIAVTGTATIDGSLPEGAEPIQLGDLEGSYTVTAGEDAVVTSADGQPIEIGTAVEGGSGTITVDGQTVEAVEMTPEQMEEMNATMQIISADDARPGTPEECAAVQPVPADQEG